MWLSFFGDLASVLGLLISLVGFVVTIWNVRQAKRAAEEARQAARDAVARVRSQLLAHDVGDSLQWVREIDSSCRDGKWQRAIVRCEDARVTLARLRDHHQLTPDEREAVIGMMNQLRLLLPLIEKKQESSGGRLSSTTTKQIHEMITRLSQIQARLENIAVEI